MTCDCIESGKPLEGTTGHSASCNYARRRAEKQALKPVKAPKPIAKVGNSNTFECSDGSKIKQIGINQMRSQAYILLESVRTDLDICEGCGGQATCHAHIIAQSRCKVINKTELIWYLDNIFPSCFECNAAIENPKGHAWKSLKNAQKCLDFIKIHDTELYQKFMVNSAGFNDKQI